MNLSSIVSSSKHIVVVQADNPDGDSLASALALEEILSDQGVKVSLFCGVEIPGYLRYMQGWDRVSSQLPKQFNASIIVDTSALSLLEILTNNGEISWLKSKPCVIIDHHTTESTIDFAKVSIIEPAVSTTEVIYRICHENNWDISPNASQLLAAGILSDSLGLTSSATTADSVEVLSQLIRLGADLAKLDNDRKLMNKKQPEILKYKGSLLQRVGYACDGELAIIDIPWSEIEKYSYMYNPAILVLDEMRQVEGVLVAVAFKSYPDGRITGKIRANNGFTYADKLAEKFGGGGHPYASGFRITDGRQLNQIKDELVDEAGKLLRKER